ncbi:MAG: helix-turn-helix domain-containing protein [Prolixibacteraceae bacterium]
MSIQTAKREETPLLHPILADALKKIFYDVVLTVFEHTKSEPEKKEVPPVYGIDTCGEVTGLARPTIYRNTSRNLMPHFKRDGKIYFKRDEIYAWMTENRVKTQSESIKEMDEKFTTKKRR